MSGRVKAGLIDFVVTAVLGLSLATELVASGRRGGGPGPLAILGILIAVNVLYHALFEFTWGASPGKLVCRLRVVGISGLPPTRRQLAIRNLGRVIDFLPNFYLVGLFLLRMHPDRGQRLGDILAGTTVRQESRCADPRRMPWSRQRSRR